ncbi:hypothetical protein V1514DRAFT_331186 [Lipomyces japonicus]|uniref:uncharacterized protein n=1 Tax=Lipomyces japonicus TaxID=56871 RepID=UPI0034CDF47B
MDNVNEYYSIEAIQAENQKVPAVFQLDVPGLGYLENTRSSSTDIKEGTHLELPLWMAEILAIAGESDDLPRGFITLTAPSPFSNKVMNALKSDPVHVNLREQCMQFYKLAELWLNFSNDDAVLDGTMTTLSERAAEINDHAHNSSAVLVQDGSDFMGRLDDFETRLFKAANESTKEVKKWLSLKK